MAHPNNMKRLMGWASVPVAFGGKGFQPVHRTGKRQRQNFYRGLQFFFQNFY